LGTRERVLLPGYGVEAVLKNTEYSAMDEKDKDAERKSGGDGGDAGELGGEEEEQEGGEAVSPGLGCVFSCFGHQ